jgi:hypothetical protein
VRNVIAPLTVASGLTAPDEAEAARAPRLGGLSAALSKTAPKAGEMSLEQAMNIAKSIPARELSPLGFYSHGAETAAGLQQAKGTPQQYYSMLEKGGVKPAELEGFNEAFAGKPSVTREEIAAHFKERMPQIEETVLGTPKFKDVNEMQAAHDAALERGDTAAADRITQNWESQFKGNTKFSQYTLPGGENYREVLLKMPEGYGASKEALADLSTAKERAASARNAYNSALSDVLEGKSNISDEALEALSKEENIANARVRNFEKLAKGPAFQSSHWREDPNVLAHIRMADRTGPNGEKILHVEEIQSDWGQKGKKEGFKGEVERQIPIALQKIQQADRNVGETFDRLAATGLTEQQVYSHPDFQAAYDQAQAAKKSYGDLNLRSKSNIPEAPYVTNTQAWTDLALKRALREAAEGGYEKLVWTPGAEQAKRYSLSTHIDEVQYSPGRNGTFSVEAYKGNNNVFNKPNATAKEIADTFGQEIAEKITSGHGEVNRNTGYNVLSGLDLETGGKGMKGYYDKIVPNQLSKLVKKLDPEAKVGMTDVMLPPKGGIGHNNPPLEAPGITITPKMREAILGGQTAFKRGGTIPFGPEAAQRAVQIAKQQAGRR